MELFRRLSTSTKKTLSWANRLVKLKKTNKEKGSVLIGIELKDNLQLEGIVLNMKKKKYNYIKINENDLLYGYLIWKKFY